MPVFMRRGQGAELCQSSAASGMTWNPGRPGAIESSDEDNTTSRFARLHDGVPAGAEIPAFRVRFSRYRPTVQQGPARRQETQIVQSWLTLRDFLP